MGTAAGVGAVHVLEGVAPGAQLSPAVVVAVWCGLALVTFAACTVPAISATPIPPASALRAG